MHNLPLFPGTIGPESWDSAVSRLDAVVFRLINSGLSCRLLDHIMMTATFLVEGIALSGMSLVFILIGWALNRASLRSAGYAGLVALAFSGAVVQISKHLWDRPRPLLATFDVVLVGRPLFVHGFPSGHTTTAFAVCVACSVFLPSFRYVLIPLAFAAGLSRVYLGIHFPLDVVCGAILGTLVGLLAAHLVSQRGAKQDTEAVSSTA